MLVGPGWCEATGSKADLPPASVQFKLVERSVVGQDHARTAGCAWGDYDDDGKLDLFVAAWNARSFLYHNDGPGGFSRIDDPGLFPNVPIHAYGAAWADYDNDGQLDLFVTRYSQGQTPEAFPNCLFRGLGDRRLALATVAEVGPVAGIDANSTGCNWVDFNRDGRLDLFVGRYPLLPNLLFLGAESGRFAVVTSGDITGIGKSEGSAAADFDNDGWPDLFVANGSARIDFLFRNDGQGTLRRITTGEIVEQLRSSRGAAWGDYDNDGLLDLHVAHQDGQSLFHNQGDGTFMAITNTALAADKLICSGGIWGDYDNDGDLDLFVVTGRMAAFQNHLLYENLGDGSFIRVSARELTEVATPGMAAAWGDYENDGFLDLFVSNGTLALPDGDPGQNDQLFHNEANTNNWLKVRCAGRVSNRSGVGARLRLHARLAVG